MSVSYYRQMFQLTQRQIEFVREESKRVQVSEAEIVRRILDEYLDVREWDKQTGEVVLLPQRASFKVDPVIPELPPEPIPDPKVKLRRDFGDEEEEG